MRKKRNRCSGRGRKGAAAVAVIATLTGAACIFVSVYIKTVAEPNLEDIAQIKAEVIVSRAVNKALAELFSEEKQRDELFIINKDENGRMELVQANSVEINILMAELSINLQQTFGNMKGEKFEIPLGSIMGSKVLSQMEPYVNVRIVPLSVSSMDFRTEFETQGINQTKYKIHILMKCRVRVIAPFSSATFETASKILIGEAVILGEVPQSYVQVPEEDILDVTDE